MTAWGFSRRDFLRASSLSTLGSLYACDSGQLDPSRPIADVISVPGGVEDHHWEDIRKSFILEDGTVYMNNASLGLPPRSVVEAVTNGYREISRDPIAGKRMLQEIIAERVKPLLAEIFKVETGELVLTRNASEGLYLQSAGLKLAPGDEVLITTQEHPAGHRPWMVREARDGIKVTEVFVPSPFVSGDDVVKRVETAIKSETKALSFCHVTRGGHRYPVKELVVLAKEHGLTVLVDGAQAVGQFPIDLSDLGCDAYSASLHKWLIGPIGTGFFFVRKTSRSSIQSPFSTDLTQGDPGYNPLGTISLPVYAALQVALDMILTLGLENIENRCRFLSDYLKESLEKVKGVEILSGNSPEISSPGSTIFEAQGVDAINFVTVMAEEHRMHVDEHQRDGHNAIRISTHIYNTQEEIDRLVTALREEMKKARGTT
tara:strand:- start:29128 stop:30420 length:1293 start_codon:yes stop_codon:yes gene_type:complete